MTSIGHSIVGASFGVAALPVSASRRYKILNLCAFVLLANFPDIPFPNWSHEFYDFSHSLPVNLALIGLLAAGVIGVSRVVDIPGRGRLIFLIACAWLSHILLDTLYSHGLGVAVFWPISPARVAIPIPWFSVLPMHPAENVVKILKIFTLEILSYGPLLVLSIRLQRLKKTRDWNAPAPIPVPVRDQTRG